MKLQIQEVVRKIPSERLYEELVRRYGKLAPSLDTLKRLERQGAAADTGYPGVVSVAAETWFPKREQDAFPTAPDAHPIAEAFKLNSTLQEAVGLLKTTRRGTALFLTLLENIDGYCNLALSQTGISPRVLGAFSLIKGHCTIYRPAPGLHRKEMLKRAFLHFEQAWQHWSAFGKPEDWDEQTVWWTLRASHNMVFVAEAIDKEHGDRGFTNFRDTATQLSKGRWWKISEEYGLLQRRPDILLNTAEAYSALGDTDGAIRALRNAFRLHPCDAKGMWKPSFLDYDLNSVPHLREALDTIGYPKSNRA
jgi:hypothetical protein